MFYAAFSWEGAHDSPLHAYHVEIIAVYLENPEAAITTVNALLAPDFYEVSTLCDS